MNAMPAADRDSARTDYGWDAPYVVRNLLLAGIACLLLAILIPPQLHLGAVVFMPKPLLYGLAISCLTEVLLFLHYVKRGKFLHRDFILRQHTWNGAEQVLDVGCGRGLLLVGAARRAPQGHMTGIDIWSQQDLSGNSEAAAHRNLVLEGVAARCTLVSAPAQVMPFADGSFDVVVSNLCLHNIYDRTTRKEAVAEIARVLRPGGQALLSDYKLTGEYAAQLQSLGFTVHRRWGSFIACFPPMRVVVATKTAA